MPTDRMVGNVVVGKRLFWHWLCCLCGRGGVSGSELLATRTAEKHVCRS